MAVAEKVYGDALYDLALEEDRIDEFYEEAACLREVLSSNQELTTMMTHPKIDKKEKQEILESVFKNRISEEMLGLMIMIVDKGHFKEMDQILSYFADRVKELKRIGVAYVTTPMPLSEDQKTKVEDRLKETTDYVSFEMNYAVDESLIGGMVVRIGDRIVDSSIRTKLEKISRELSKVQLKVGETAS